jgi:hypothetical protein
MPVKNRLVDLNDHLFAQLERLNDEELSEEELEKEIKRSKHVVAVSKSIIANANTMKDAAKIMLEYGRDSQNKMPSILQIEGTEKDIK